MLASDALGWTRCGTRRDASLRVSRRILETTAETGKHGKNLGACSTLTLVQPRKGLAAVGYRIQSNYIPVYPNFPMDNSKAPSKPVKVFRLLGISASVFANRPFKGSNTPFYKVSLQRTYKDGDEFRTTTSFSRDDLPVADLLIRRAWEFILESEMEGRRAASDEEDND